MSMKSKASATMQIVALAGGLLALADPVRAESYVLPSSAFRSGTNAAEFHTDVRILNQGTAAVTVTATFYDQVTSAPVTANAFRIEARNQASFDNILQSLFGKTLDDGAYGPIRFESTGPILAAASVNNVNACGSGAVSGQWLPGIAISAALKSGAIGQLAVSSSTASGYRTNLVFMNPSSAPATATVKVRSGGGSLLSTQAIGPLPPNGFRQVALESLPGVGGTTDTNLWLEFTSDQPVLAYATIINNVSGDPFAVVATADVGSGTAPSRLYLSGLLGGPLSTEPTSNSTAAYVCMSQLEWSTTMTGDLAGTAYTFNLGLITSNASSGSGTMRADILHRAASAETVLATATFTTSPQYLLNHLTVTGLDPDAKVGDTLLLRLTRVSGQPCVFWSPGASGVHYVEVPPTVP